MSVRLRKTTQIKDNNGRVVFENNEQTFTGWNEEEGSYYYRNRSNTVYIYSDVKFPRCLNNKDIGKLMRLIPLISSENNLFSEVKDKRIRYRKGQYKIQTLNALTLIDIMQEIGDSKHSFRSFWNRCIEGNVVKRINNNGKMFWAMNPYYINSCRHIPYWLYAEFKIELKRKLPSWVIKNFEDRIERESGEKKNEI